MQREPRQEPEREPTATREIRAEERRSQLPKVILGLALVVLFLVFVTQNSDPVVVRFLWFDSRVPLIWVFLGCAAIGALVLFLVQRPSRRLVKRYIRELERQRQERG